MPQMEPEAVSRSEVKPSFISTSHSLSVTPAVYRKPMRASLRGEERVRTLVVLPVRNPEEGMKWVGREGTTRVLVTLWARTGSPAGGPRPRSGPF